MRTAKTTQMICKRCGRIIENATRQREYCDKCNLERNRLRAQARARQKKEHPRKRFGLERLCAPGESEVKTYLLSPEELKAYGPVNKKICACCGQEKPLRSFINRGYLDLIGTNLNMGWESDTCLECRKSAGRAGRDNGQAL